MKGSGQDELATPREYAFCFSEKRVLAANAPAMGVWWSAGLGDAVRRRGAPVPVDPLVASELVLPAQDTSLEQLRLLLVGERLIPGRVASAPDSSPGG